eukprot:scaffold23640_cov18-Tisochrysis_lutea.AAC.2
MQNARYVEHSLHGDTRTHTHTHAMHGSNVHFVSSTTFEADGTRPSTVTPLFAASIHSLETIAVVQQQAGDASAEHRGNAGPLGPTQHVRKCAGVVGIWLCEGMHHEGHQVQKQMQQRQVQRLTRRVMSPSAGSSAVAPGSHTSVEGKDEGEEVHAW